MTLGSIRSPSRIAAEAQQHSLESLDLLEHPAFRRACARLQERALKAFRLSDPADHAAREGSFWMLRALDALATQLTAEITGSEITKHNFRHILKKDDEE